MWFVKENLILLVIVGPFIWTDRVDASVRWPRVILMGDSLTQFSFRYSGQWGALVADRLTERPVHRKAGIADVINRGFGGFTSADYLNQWQEIMSQEKGSDVAALTLMLGTNDSPRGVSTLDYRSNMQNLLLKLMDGNKIPRDRLILLCPPPTDHSRKTYDTVAYREVILSLGHDLNITVVNLYDIFERDPRKSALYKDGVHFSPIGSQLVFDSVMPVIQQKVDEYLANNSSTPLE